MTEPDFDAAFGCRGTLISGSRSPGKRYTVEWCDDDIAERVSFGADRKWVGIDGAPIVGTGRSNIPTPCERLKLALWRIGIDVR